MLDRGLTLSYRNCAGFVQWPRGFLWGFSATGVHGNRDRFASAARNKIARASRRHEIVSWLASQQRVKLKE